MWFRHAAAAFAVSALAQFATAEDVVGNVAKRDDSYDATKTVWLSASSDSATTAAQTKYATPLVTHVVTKANGEKSLESEVVSKIVDDLSVLVIRQVTIFVWEYALGSNCPDVVHGSDSKGGFWVGSDHFGSSTEACGNACEKQFKACSAAAGHNFRLSDCLDQFSRCQKAAGQKTGASHSQITHTQSVVLPSVTGSGGESQRLTTWLNGGSYTVVSTKTLTASEICPIGTGGVSIITLSGRGSVPTISPALPHNTETVSHVQTTEAVVVTNVNGGSTNYETVTMTMDVPKSAETSIVATEKGETSALGENTTPGSGNYPVPGGDTTTAAAGTTPAVSGEITEGGVTYTLPPSVYSTVITTVVTEKCHKCTGTSTDVKKTKTLTLTRSKPHGSAGTPYTTPAEAGVTSAAGETTTPGSGNYPVPGGNTTAAAGETTTPGSGDYPVPGGDTTTAAAGTTPEAGVTSAAGETTTPGSGNYPVPGGDTTTTAAAAGTTPGSGNYPLPGGNTTTAAAGTTPAEAGVTSAAGETTTPGSGNYPVPGGDTTTAAAGTTPAVSGQTTEGGEVTRTLPPSVYTTVVTTVVTEKCHKCTGTSTDVKKTQTLTLTRTRPHASEITLTLTRSNGEKTTEVSTVAVGNNTPGTGYAGPSSALGVQSSASTASTTHLTMTIPATDSTGTATTSVLTWTVSSNAPGSTGAYHYHTSAESSAESFAESTTPGNTRLITMTRPGAGPSDTATSTVLTWTASSGVPGSTGGYGYGLPPSSETTPVLGSETGAGATSTGTPASTILTLTHGSTTSLYTWTPSSQAPASTGGHGYTVPGNSDTTVIGSETGAGATSTGTPASTILTLSHGSTTSLYTWTPSSQAPASTGGHGYTLPGNSDTTVIGSQTGVGGAKTTGGAGSSVITLSHGSTTSLYTWTASSQAPASTGGHGYTLPGNSDTTVAGTQTGAGGAQTTGAGSSTILTLSHGSTTSLLTFTYQTGLPTGSGYNHATTTTNGGEEASVTSTGAGGSYTVGGGDVTTGADHTVTKTVTVTKTSTTTEASKTVTVTGADHTVTVTGSGKTVTVTGSGETVTITNSGHTETITVGAGHTETVTATGSGKTVTVGGGSGAECSGAVTKTVNTCQAGATTLATAARCVPTTVTVTKGGQTYATAPAKARRMLGL